MTQSHDLYIIILSLTPLMDESRCFSTTGDFNQGKGFRELLIVI